MKFVFLALLPFVYGFRIHGVNWFGFETEYGSLFCDKTNNFDWNLKKMSDLGFNFLRLPFCSDYIHNNQWEGMDDFFNAVKNYNISVVLDYHRLNNHQQSAKPYDDQHSFGTFLNDWNIIIDRYKNNSHLVGVDIFNEFQPDDPNEWNNLAIQTLENIEYHFPNRFIYLVGCVNWGGNCRFINVDDNLPYKDRVYYTIHKYCWSDTEPLEEKWDLSFGDYRHNLIVGEFGYKSDKPEQKQWFRRFVDYLRSRNILDSFFWCWNPNSVDTGGILKDDCNTIDYDKINLLNYYWFEGRYLRYCQK